MGRHSTRGRAGLTLIEMSVVLTFVSLFALLLMGAVRTSTMVNRDTWCEGEVVDVAERTVDDVAKVFAQAGEFIVAGDAATLAGERVQFQSTYDPIESPGPQLVSTQLGIFYPDTSNASWKAGWRYDVQWVANGAQHADIVSPIPGNSVDMDEDGVIAGDLVDMGVIRIRVVDNAGATVVDRFVGGGAVRIVRSVGPAGAPTRIFSRPPTLANPSSATPSMLDHSTEVLQITPVMDQGVQINLKVAYNAIRSGNMIEQHVARVSRVVTRRSRSFAGT
jgi:hypothetical protein